jgi:hypothetical protein
MHSLNKHHASFHNLSASESATTLIRLQTTCAALQSFSPPSETFELQKQELTNPTQQWSGSHERRK